MVYVTGLKVIFPVNNPHFYTYIPCTAEVDSDAETADQDEAIMEALSTKIAAAKEKLGGDPGDVIFETYTMLGDYIDKDSGVALRCGETVEVMDSENPHGWLVRKSDDKAKVCSVHVFCFWFFSV